MLDNLADLVLAFGGAMLFTAPAVALIALAERSKKVKKFFEWVGEKYF